MVNDSLKEVNHPLNSLMATKGIDNNVFVPFINERNRMGNLIVPLEK